MKIVSVDEMRELDRRTMAEVITPQDLMHNAGYGAYEEIMRFFQALPEKHKRQATVLAGKGNNGGDAYVVARYLASKEGMKTTVYSVCDPQELKGEAAFHASQLPQIVDVQVIEQIPDDALKRGTIIVDGLLGTGISGGLREPYGTIVSQVNHSSLPVAALDIPSGINGDTGQIGSEAVNADVTLTMAQPKRGLLTGEAMAHCGCIKCVDIGIPPEFVAETKGTGEAITETDTICCLQRRQRDTHKGKFGHVLVVGGSKLYTGAPALAASAASRAGAGLVTVAVPESVRPLLPSANLGLIFNGIPDEEMGFFSEIASKPIQELSQSCDTMILGPGLGQDTSVIRFAENLAISEGPIVIDADGLRLLPQCLKKFNGSSPVVLTPHPGELRFLLKAYGLKDALEQPRTEQCQTLAKALQAHVVGKGMGTCVVSPEGKTSINTSGSPALSTGGSGDVLSGVIAAFLAEGRSAWDACRTGVFIHGHAADIADTGMRGLIADDVAELLPEAMKDVSPFG